MLGLSGNSTWWRLGAVGALVMLTTSTVLIATALNAPVWFTFELRGLTYEFGLFECKDCPERHASYSTDCFNTYDCQLNSASNLCRIGRLAYEASIRYFWLSMGSFVSSLMLSERVLFMLLKRDYGQPVLLYLLAGLLSFLQTSAVVVWFTSSKASFAGPCSASKDEDVGLCASSGPVIATCAAVLSSVTAGVTSLLVKCRDTKYDEGVRDIANGKVMGISQSKWLLVKSAPVIFTGLVLQLMALCWHWVHYSAASEHRGFLLYMDHYLTFEDLSFNCIFGPACSSQMSFHAEVRNCTAFKRLWQAGYAYLCMDSAALMFCLLWIEGLVYFVIKREFGLPVLQYMWPVLTILLHVSAIAVWLVTSGVMFGNNCSVKHSDEDIDFCPDKGLSLAVWGSVCFLFSACFYCFIYANRRDLTGRVLCQVKDSWAPDKCSDAAVNETNTQEDSFDDSLRFTAKNRKIKPYTHSTTLSFASASFAIEGDETVPLSRRKSSKGLCVCLLCKETL
jgi:hypothetical protein